MGFMRNTALISTFLTLFAAGTAFAQTKGEKPKSGVTLEELASKNAGTIWDRSIHGGVTATYYTDKGNVDADLTRVNYESPMLAPLPIKVTDSIEKIILKTDEMARGNYTGPVFFAHTTDVQSKRSSKEGISYKFLANNTLETKGFKSGDEGTLLSFAVLGDYKPDEFSQFTDVKLTYERDQNNKLCVYATFSNEKGDMRTENVILSTVGRTLAYRDEADFVKIVDKYNSEKERASKLEKDIPKVQWELKKETTAKWEAIVNNIFLRMDYEGALKTIQDLEEMLSTSTHITSFSGGKQVWDENQHGNGYGINLKQNGPSFSVEMLTNPMLERNFEYKGSFTVAESGNGSATLELDGGEKFTGSLNGSYMVLGAEVSAYFAKVLGFDLGAGMGVDLQSMATHGFVATPGEPTEITGVVPRKNPYVVFKIRKLIKKDGKNEYRCDFGFSMGPEYHDEASSSGRDGKISLGLDFYANPGNFEIRGGINGHQTTGTRIQQAQEQLYGTFTQNRLEAYIQAGIKAGAFTPYGKVLHSHSSGSYPTGMKIEKSDTRVVVGTYVKLRSIVDKIKQATGGGSAGDTK